VRGQRQLPPDRQGLGADGDHVDVHAPRLAAPRREHALPLDLRQQRGGRDGRFRFLAFYLLGGIAATTLQALVTFHWGSPGDSTVANLGASGAISSVLGAYLVLLPSASVLTFVFVLLIEVPAILFLGAWFLFQLWQGGYAVTHPDPGGGVAFFAHVGGFAFGFLTVRLFAVRDPLPPRGR
jgi:membrane associated rhomboid family serine protease